MSKILVPFLIIVIFIVAIIKLGPARLFTPGAVQKVKHKQDDLLKSEAINLEKKYKTNLKDVEKVATAYERLGKRYLDNKSWTPAIEALQKSIEYGNNGVFVQHFLAVALANRGKFINNETDFDMAEKHYKMAIEKNSKMYDSYYGLGILYYYHKEKRAEAKKIMNTILAKNSNYYDAYIALGRMYFEEKQYNSSLKIYNELFASLNVKPDSPQIRAYKEVCRKNIPLIISKIPKEMKPDGR